MISRAEGFLTRPPVIVGGGWVVLKVFIYAPLGGRAIIIRIEWAVVAVSDSEK